MSDGKSCCTPTCTRADGTAVSYPAFARVTSGDVSDMVFQMGGTFLMGADDEVGFPDDGEGPVREVTVDPFYIGKYSVTNRDFDTFVRRTKYRTEAEEFGWSFVFWLLLPPYRRKEIQGQFLEKMDLCLYAKNNGIDVANVAAIVGITAGQVRMVFDDIDAKRKTTRYLHLPALLMKDVVEIKL